MSHQSTLPRANPLKLENLPSLGGKRFSAPPMFMLKMQSTSSGLITPPGSPTLSMPAISSFGAHDQSTMQVPSGELHQTCLTASSPKSERSQCSHSEPVSPSSSTNFSVVSEEIYTIIEQAAEQKIADAIAPLRLNISRLEDSLRQSDNALDGIKSLGSHLRRENTDLRDQNDTLSRQLDLHYRTIEQHTDTFNSQVNALNSILETQSKNVQATAEALAASSWLISHLSQVVMNLPGAVNQVVHNAVHQQTQMALDDMLEAQHDFILAMRGMRESSSVSSDDDTTLQVCDNSSIESITSTEHMSTCSSRTSDRGSRGIFRSTFRKLFKSTRQSRAMIW
ncbi:hypothetical protein PT974_02462 [Cladobotryum mycophilum]|uniref:Uncharacterized protein n=1 Tax=Cladobotryum mycophilum TaxID=491253 RepID=A0ABR0SZB7_9HYPO